MSKKLPVVLAAFMAILCVACGSCGQKPKKMAPMEVNDKQFAYTRAIDAYTKTLKNRENFLTRKLYEGWAADARDEWKKEEAKHSAYELEYGWIPRSILNDSLTAMQNEREKWKAREKVEGYTITQVI